MSPEEHQVVVVFDVTADDRLSAARAVVGVLGGTRGRYVLDGGALASTVVESWWFPEAELKQVDRNDNAALQLVHTDEVAVDGLYVEDDADDEPTVWLHQPDEPDRPIALLSPGNLGRRGRDLLWPHIVRGLPTAPPAAGDAGSAGLAAVLLVGIFGGLLMLAAVALGQQAMCAAHNDALRYCPGYEAQQ